MSRGYHAARKQAEIADHALHDPMSAEQLRDLAGHGSVIERTALAERPDLPLAVMSALVEDSRKAVRIALAHNPAIFRAPSIVELLIGEGDPGVLAGIAANPAADAGTLQALAQHRHREVRHAAEISLHGEKPVQASGGARMHGSATGGDPSPEQQAGGPSAAELAARRALATGGARFHGASRRRGKATAGGLEDTTESDEHHRG